MDISYKLKDDLKCCDWDLSYDETLSNGYYTAVCGVCGKRFEIGVSIRTLEEETNEKGI